MYYLKVNHSFDAAHFLRHYQGKCANIHGHTWNIQIIVKGEVLNHQGMLIDFGILRQNLKEVLEEFDHKLINDLPYFSEHANNPTAENIAYYIFKILGDKLPDEVFLDAVEVWESPKSAAIYRRD